MSSEPVSSDEALLDDSSLAVESDAPVPPVAPELSSVEVSSAEVGAVELLALELFDEVVLAFVVELVLELVAELAPELCDVWACDDAVPVEDRAPLEDVALLVVVEESEVESVDAAGSLVSVPAQAAVKLVLRAHKHVQIGRTRGALFVRSCITNRASMAAKFSSFIFPTSGCSFPRSLPRELFWEAAVAASTKI